MTTDRLRTFGFKPRTFLREQTLPLLLDNPASQMHLMLGLHTTEPVHGDGLAETEAQATEFGGQDFDSHVAGG